MENKLQLIHVVPEMHMNDSQTSIRLFSDILTLFRAPMQLLATLKANIRCCISLLPDPGNSDWSNPEVTFLRPPLHSMV